MRAHYLFVLAMSLVASAGVALAEGTPDSSVNDQSISVSDGRAVIVSGNQQLIVGPNGDLSVNGSPAVGSDCTNLSQVPSGNSTVSVQSGGRSIQLKGGVVSITSGDQRICLNLGDGIPASTATVVPPPQLSAPQVGPGAALVGQDLHGQSFAGRDLHGSDLTGADLRGVDFSNANLGGAVLVGADLSGAHLAGADLSQARLVGSDLTAADLHGAHLTGANVTGADFTGAHLEGADFTGATTLDPDQFQNAIVDGSTKLPSH